MDTNEQIKEIMNEANECKNSKDKFAIFSSVHTGQKFYVLTSEQIQLLREL